MDVLAMHHVGEGGGSIGLTTLNQTRRRFLVRDVRFKIIKHRMRRKILRDQETNRKLSTLPSLLLNHHSLPPPTSREAAFTPLSRPPLPLSLHAGEERAARPDTGGRLGPGATARRRLVLVKAPDADGVRYVGERAGRGGADVSVRTN